MLKTQLETIAMASPHSIKVGIDFGTTYSGVSWVQPSSYTRLELKVKLLIGTHGLT
jgi:molecular chaperone DnaK (HSP70)